MEEEIGNLDVWVVSADPNIQISIKCRVPPEGKEVEDLSTARR